VFQPLANYIRQICDVADITINVIVLQNSYDLIIRFTMIQQLQYAYNHGIQENF